MLSNHKRFTRWIMLAASGTVLLQMPGCDLALQAVSTGLLAVLTGLTFNMARNI